MYFFNLSICFTRIQGTIHKYINNMNIDNTFNNAQLNTNSWCQIVLDLLDLTFAELFYGFPQ